MTSGLAEASWRVAITGIGMVTPLGHTGRETVDRILAGDSALGIQPEKEGGVAAAVVAPFDITAILKNPKNLKLMSRTVRMAMMAAREAVDEAGLPGAGLEAERIGVYAGSGQTGLDYDEFLKAMTLAWEGGREQNYQYIGGMPSRVIDRYFSLRTLSNSGIAALSTEFGARGPSNNYVQGETAPAVALYDACQDLAEGRCDAAIVCGYDSMIIASMMMAARQMNLLSGDGFDATYTPFRAGRPGIVAGEGAACFVLERAADAAARGASVIAEIDGIGFASQTADVDGFTAPAEDIGFASGEALGASLPDFVVARGLGTEADDQAEVEALKGIISLDAPVTAFKGQTGYLGGATAIVELGIGLLCARRGLVPAIRGLEEVDGGLRFVCGEPLRLPSRELRGLFFSSTFGGQVAAIAARALGCPSD